MSRFVCYMPSYNDSELIAQSLATVPDWEVVISDNASDAPHREALDRLASNRVRVIHQPKQLGRVGNWRFCVDHFAASGAEWLKFLPAGDRNKPDSLAICQRAVEAHPQARSFVFNIEIVWPDLRHPWSMADHVLVLEPPQVMLEAASRGNVFYGLLTALVHVDALRQGYAFAEDVLSYCADMLFQLGLARWNATYFYPQVVAEFVATNRKTFQVGQFALEHLIEESLMRLRAADYHAAMTGDRQLRDQLTLNIAKWLGGGLSQAPEKLLGH